MTRTTVVIRCDRCSATRSQLSGSHLALRHRARHNGWTYGLLDWPDPQYRWHPRSLVDRCGRCTRQWGEPRPIGPTEGPNYGKRPHPRLESDG